MKRKFFQSWGTMKTCSKCGIDKEPEDFHKNKSQSDGLQSQCNNCRRAYRQTEAGRKYWKSKAGKSTHQKACRKYRQDHPDREKAVSIVNNAIKMGKLLRPFVCEDCSTEVSVEAHHEDYSKPLEVNWLCKKCHEKLRKRK